MTEHSFAAGTGSLPSIERAPPAFVAAWVLSFSIPWDDMILLPGRVPLARVLALMVALIWVASILRGGAVRRPDIAHGWMGAFLPWTAVSVFWSIFPENTVRRSLPYLQLFTIAWVTYQFSANRTCYLKLLQALMHGEYVLLGGVLFSYFSSGALGDGRYSAPGVDANDVASTPALGVAWRTANFSCSWENKNVTWLLWGLMPGYPLPQRSPAVFVFQRIPSRGSAALHVES